MGRYLLRSTCRQVSLRSPTAGAVRALAALLFPGANNSCQTPATATRGVAGHARCIAATAATAGTATATHTIDRELLAELDREEPLSLAEELDKAAERVRRVGAAIARDDARDRNVHIAELQRMTMPELIAAAEREKLTEDHRPEEAGPDLPHPQGAGEAQRPDVRRGDAGDPARRFRLPPQPRLPLPLLPRRHLRLAEPDSPLRPAERQHGGRHDPPAQGERALLRPAARRGDQRRRSQPAGSKKVSFDDLTPAASRQADRHGDRRRRDRDARGRHDRADRLRPARPDRQPAAGRQDDPDAEDGQERADQLPRRLRDHAADRRAARGSHRHGAAGQRPQLRGDQLARSTRPPPATCRSPRWSSRRPSGWSNTAAT